MDMIIPLTLFLSSCLFPILEFDFLAVEWFETSTPNLELDSNLMTKALLSSLAPKQGSV